VEANSTLKKNWILTPEAFAKLLAAFAPDSNEEAGAKYEAARIRLIKLFQWRGIFDAEEAADETLNRVARKIDEGEIVRDISAFIGGIARFVLLEKLKSKERTNVALEDAPPTAFVKQPEEFADDRRMNKSCAVLIAVCARCPMKCGKLSSSITTPTRTARSESSIANEWRSV
jgi:hypothetical protein